MAMLLLLLLLLLSSFLISLALPEGNARRLGLYKVQRSSKLIIQITYVSHQDRTRTCRQPRIQPGATLIGPPPLIAQLLTQG